MKFKYAIKTAGEGLRIHKSRSALTVLGILIGISSIILMMSIGKGAENLILNEIGGLGAETIVVRPGKEPTGPTDFGDTLFADSLKTKDIEALEKKGNVPDLVDITPFLMIPGSVSYQGETFRPTLMGSKADVLMDTFNIYPEFGSVFDDDQIRQNASVVMIGYKVKEELFGSSDAVGEFIKVKDRKMRVVGVFPKKGQVSFMNIDELVIVPYTTAQKYLLGIDYFHEVMIKVSSPEVVDRAVLDIERTLRNSHGITDPDKDDFFVVTQQGMVEQIGAIMGALTIFLSSVVAIALVVGGIGVMNIMLVSVTERTREIGLRKALGATEGDITQQFLFEAIMLSILGGLAGVALGASLSFLVFIAISNYFNPNWTFSFPFLAAILGVLVSSLVGLVFGIYPAKQAAKKSPIEALRYE